MNREGRAIDREARIPVRLTPRAGRDAIEGIGPDGRLHVLVRAAPVDGGANEALVRIVAEALGVPRRSVAIRVGATSRDKLLVVEGIGADEVRRRWPPLGPSDPGSGRAP